MRATRSAATARLPARRVRLLNNNNERERTACNWHSWRLESHGGRSPLGHVPGFGPLFSIAAIPVSPASAVRVSHALLLSPPTEFVPRARLSQIFPCFCGTDLLTSGKQSKTGTARAASETKKKHSSSRKGGQFNHHQTAKSVLCIARSIPPYAPRPLSKRAHYSRSEMDGRTWWCIRNQTTPCRSRACFELVMRSCLFRSPSAAHPPLFIAPIQCIQEKE